MKFSKGDLVFLTSLKKHGTVFAVLKSGLYQVVVGNLSVECREADLSLFGKAKKDKKGSVRDVRAEGKVSRKSHRAGSLYPTVDLHGMLVKDAMQLVETRIDRAILDDVEGLQIVHGIGTGKIREALHSYLKNLNVVKSFKVDEGNPGMTWVYF